MDERFRMRRKDVRRMRGRRRLFMLMAVAGLALAAGGFLWLRDSDVFAVDRVVMPSTEHVTVEEIGDSLRSAYGMNLLRISTDDLAAGLRSLPYVESARVYRRFPHSLEVELEERTPVAALSDSADARWLVSIDGHILEEWEDAVSRDGEFDVISIIPEFEFDPEVGAAVPPSIRGALLVVDELRPDGIGRSSDGPGGVPDGSSEGSVGFSGISSTGPLQVEHIGVAGEGAVTLTLASGSEVRLGNPVQIHDKLRVAAEIVERYSRDGRKLVYVDVRSPSKAVAKADEP